jgi:hypothetical protein
MGEDAGDFHARDGLNTAGEDLKSLNAGGIQMRDVKHEGATFFTGACPTFVLGQPGRVRVNQGCAWNDGMSFF